VIRDPARRIKYAPLVAYIQALGSGNLPAASQGVVVGGIVEKEVRVLNNTFTRVGQAVHVALGGHHLTGQRAGAVVVAGNVVEGWASPASPFERFGIYVGGCDSVRVERNDLALFRPVSVPAARVEGIRLRGTLGRMAMVRENQVSNYTVGIAVYPQASAPTPRRWAVADNVCFGAANTVIDGHGQFDKVGNVP
jgi:hypothetical protein